MGREGRGSGQARSGTRPSPTGTPSTQHRTADKREGGRERESQREGGSQAPRAIGHGGTALGVAGWSAARQRSGRHRGCGHTSCVPGRTFLGTDGERGREGQRDGAEGGREGGSAKGREGGQMGGREGEKEGERERACVLRQTSSSSPLPCFLSTVAPAPLPPPLSLPFLPLSSPHFPSPSCLSAPLTGPRRSCTHRAPVRSIDPRSCVCERGEGGVRERDGERFRDGGGGLDPAAARWT